jgi:Mn-dependent DtxR family transcriptional regulator
LGPGKVGEVSVEIDIAKVDEAVLAVLYLTLHDGTVAWKTIDWDAMRRLHERGLITDPVGKQKSVVLTDDGLREAERCFKKLCAKG